ncbi:flavin-linked sulfhydryl oxidase NDAI_0A01260 [Naumovozyma dairenensis CBS 421]|uniref:Sulfhydryl oxidase n=1 Tax=Naumovozyma dairenensis (strain ATCC 10597 / BCRC 20456 / CBS 421 / NBRC 0211 / NRRL Y-12639) TaxID=1071378 RepID=G0W396_NAUDC|nr:hypothetical protein NDAI_0A01260 [Naumovozyma dairenensis CBS 421]CCD22284.1 hypothetical protein NDAI_0A01260 [Naumovozyma dairenensis CBS 421]
MFNKFPEKPSRKESNGMVSYIKLFEEFYPYRYNEEREEEEDGYEYFFDEMLDMYPPCVSSRLCLSLWGCQIHNLINERIYYKNNNRHDDDEEEEEEKKGKKKNTNRKKFVKYNCSNILKDYELDDTVSKPFDTGNEQVEEDDEQQYYDNNVVVMDEISLTKEEKQLG